MPSFARTGSTTPPALPALPSSAWPGSAPPCAPLSSSTAEQVRGRDLRIAPSWATRTAAASASWDLIVNLSACI